MAQSILNSSLRSNDHQYINIENFENPQFKDSKWVLTSPRSLLACDNLGIQPAEIVSNSLGDTFDSIGSKNATLPVVYQLFSEKEVDRKIKISQIRLERLNLIQKEKDAMNLNENSIRNLYDSLKLEQEIRGEDAPLNSTLRTEDSLSKIRDLELKLADLKKQENDLLNSQKTKMYTNPRFKTYNKSNYEDDELKSYFELNNSFDPFSYTKMYPNKPVFDMKSLSLAKQAQFEAQFDRTMENSRRLAEENQNYYENKMSNINESINNAADNKERLLAERSMRIFMDRQEKLSWKEENLNRSQTSQMMKSLVSLNRIRNKDKFISAKNKNNALTVHDLI